MAAYEITGAFTTFSSPVVPYDYGGGTLFAIAFDALGDYGTDDPSTLRVFKSTDAGQTWTSAGGGTKDVLTRLDTDHDSRRVITRAHPDWPSTPYLYALYCNTDAQLHISRYDAAGETWDQESTGDLDVSTTLPGGFGNLLAWSFDWVDDGDAGGLLYNDTDGYLHTNSNRYQRVSYAPITRSALSIGTPVRCDGQPDTDIGFRAADVRRGKLGTLHGFASQSDPEGVEPETTYQAVLRFTGAGPGAPELVELDTGVVGIPYWAQREDRGGNTYIHVLVAESTPGNGQRLYVGESQTAGVTFAEVTSEDGDGNDRWQWSVAPNADMYRAWPYPAEDLQRQTYDGVALGSLDLVHDAGATIGTLGAGAFGVGSACVFSIVGSIAAQQCWFAGVVPITLLGGEGIKSEEAFGRTHGVTGGGDPQSCGTPVVIPPSPTCGPIDVTDVSDEQRDTCPTYGYSY